MLNRLHQLLPENSRQYREEISQRITWGHWFALFNIIIALIIASRYAFNSDWPNTLAGKLYFFVSLFGHFSFVVFAIYLLLLFPLSFVIKNSKTYRSISVLIATVGMAFLLLDTEVFKRFFLHLSPLVWDLLINPDEAELSRKWQLLFVPMPLIFLAEMLFSRWSWQKLRSLSRQRWGKYVALFFLSCFSATHLLYASADLMLYRPITAQKANYPLSYPMTVRSFLERHNLLDRVSFEQKLEEQGRPDTFYLNYPRHTLRYQNVPAPINLLFINLSGLSNEAIQTAQMPHLSNIAAKSRRFMQHYSSGDNITAGIAGLFYGISGRYVDAILNEQEPSALVTSLEKAHYQFGLFSHNGFAEPIYQRALFKDFSLPQTQGNQQSIAQWQQWLENRAEQPFFSYLELDALVPLPTLDNQIAQIWQALEQHSLLSRTLVVITADLASFESLPNMFDKKRIQVPMLIYWQGEASRYTAMTSHLDILPTILRQFFGVSSPISDYSQGIDLTQPNERKWLLSSNYKRNVAIMPDGEQFHVDAKGDFEHYDQNGEKLQGSRPPLALFLQLIQHSNQFIEK
ncbi:DUF3413 domain-containing protein [Bibersteinia trehalosi]|uniref:DUF3413 domain-containing protein n=1 Tax=Bibersteinia trehalosi TaxID=47735 RepID=A0A3R8LCX6_BIBTR|nr:DUF3413 domain-containing protein [Bibersteinia trehalosi]RRN02617.1 DUF3413 domain-containing protein [Bibersteinia trehalosi]